MKIGKPLHWKLLYSMLKIGCIGFGGGNAVVPVMEKELVEDKAYVKRKKYEETIMIANVTPGALPVEIACGIGNLYGKKNMVLSAVAMALPGCLLSVLLLSVFMLQKGALVQQIGYLCLGIIPFVVWELFSYVRKTIQSAKKESTLRLYKVLLITLVVFLLVCGKNVNKLFFSGELPWVSISTITVFGLSLFFIFFCNGKYQFKTSVPSLLLIASYLLLEFFCKSKYADILKGVLIFLMVLLVVWKVIDCYQGGEKRSEGTYLRNLLKEVGIWSLFLAIFSIAGILWVNHTVVLMAKGIYSTVISFGGGDAYLSVVEGLFVDGGFLSGDDLYEIVIPVVNVLPGSILCKSLTSIGYLWGLSQTGTLLGGCVIALAGFACSVTASGVIYCGMTGLYNCFSTLQIFIHLRRWIRPIVSGLLLNVILSLVLSGGNLSEKLYVGKEIWVLVFGGVFAFGILLNRFKKENTTWMVLFSFGLAITIFNLFNYCTSAP